MLLRPLVIAWASLAGTVESLIKVACRITSNEDIPAMREVIGSVHDLQGWKEYISAVLVYVPSSLGNKDLLKELFFYDAVQVKVYDLQSNGAAIRDDAPQSPSCTTADFLTANATSTSSAVITSGNYSQMTCNNTASSISRAAAAEEVDDEVLWVELDQYLSMTEDVLAGRQREPESSFRCKLELVGNWATRVTPKIQRINYVPEPEGKIKVALLVPTKSTNGASPLVKHLWPTLHKSITDLEKAKYHYTVYLGYDQDDSIVDEESFNIMISESIKASGLPISVVKQEMPPVKMVTLFWNLLSKTAYEDGQQYLYQINDDANINSVGWTEDFVTALQSNGNWGVSAPWDAFHKDDIFTQAMVSAKHQEIFGFFFPPEIPNWYCDSWMTEIYKAIGKATCFQQHPIENYNVPVRYSPCPAPDWESAVDRDVKVLHYLIKQSESVRMGTSGQTPRVTRTGSLLSILRFLRNRRRRRRTGDANGFCCCRNCTTTV